MRFTWIAAIALALSACSSKEKTVSFKSDLDFLKANTEIVLLSDPAGQAQVAVSPAWQGRVMTSTAAGESGNSFGWINREVIAAKKIEPHINVYGGEDRFWLGPEGGPFSIYFEKGKEQVFANWQTPAVIDTLPFKTISASPAKATFGQKFQLKNASGTSFEVDVKRSVELLDPAKAYELIGVGPAQGVKLVAYQTDNTITNAGKDAWKKDTGLLSIWILGMFTPSPEMTIVVPVGMLKQVNDTYFGKVPADRLKIVELVPPTSVPRFMVYFSGDGKYRSKIGVAPNSARPNLGSYDAQNKVLTIVQYNKPADMSKVSYVNSMWGAQKDPYAGDVVNSYNDGPASPGAKPMGPFYELETSSPGAELAPGASLSHIHRTIHLQGDEKALDPIAKQVFGVSLEQIKTALKK